MEVGFSLGFLSSPSFCKATKGCVCWGCSTDSTRGHLNAEKLNLNRPRTKLENIQVHWRMPDHALRHCVCYFELGTLCETLKPSYTTMFSFSSSIRGKVLELARTSALLDFATGKYESSIGDRLISVCMCFCAIGELIWYTIQSAPYIYSMRIPLSKESNNVCCSCTVSSAGTFTLVMPTWMPSSIQSLINHGQANRRLTIDKCSTFRKKNAACSATLD
jgi:hypothetical protein